jgi:DNA repair protein RadC
MSVHYHLRPVPADSVLGCRLTSPTDAAALLIHLIGTEAVEVCSVLCLSTKRELLSHHILSRGTVDTTLVHPRDVFRTALLANARAVVIGHNHPSGDVTPSAEDVAVTARLGRAAQVVGIDLIDHLIVSAEGRSYSFQHNGLLQSTASAGEMP